MTGVGTATREQVAAEVRAAAARRRVTQTFIAKRLGVSQQALSRRFTGELPFETDLLAEIANLLGMEPRDFFPPAGSISVATVGDFPPVGRARKAAKRRRSVYNVATQVNLAA